MLRNISELQTQTPGGDEIASCNKHYNHFQQISAINTYILLSYHCN